MRFTSLILLGVTLFVFFPEPPRGNTTGESEELGKLPAEIAEVFRNTLLPSVGKVEVIDLNLDGTDEIAILSHAPVAIPQPSQGIESVVFQSLVMLFERPPSNDSGGSFPYRLVATKSEQGASPKPAHVAIRNVGDDPDPEIVWLYGGPDLMGRYSKAIVYSFVRGSDRALREVARFETASGWVRVHDLDEDGVSEIIEFVEEESETVCPDLLFCSAAGWITLSEAIRNLGDPDVMAFQTRCGLSPTGRITRDVLTEVKVQTGSADPFAPGP